MDDQHKTDTPAFAYLVGPGVRNFISGKIYRAGNFAREAEDARPCLYCERANPADRLQCDGCGSSLHVKKT